MLGGGDAVASYSDFALGATAFLEDGEPKRFRDLSAASFNTPAFAAHLSTLFPDVRPRGYLELRCIDAISPERRRQALMFIAGIFSDDDAHHELAHLIGAPDAGLLATAARSGLRAAELAARAGDLVSIAVAGYRRTYRNATGSELLFALLD
jgi:glutamate--cysteine ligase